jgi:hypothetical protein
MFYVEHRIPKSKVLRGTFQNQRFYVEHSESQNPMFYVEHSNIPKSKVLRGTFQHSKIKGSTWNIPTFQNQRFYVEHCFFCHSVANGSDAPTSCEITYATNFVNLKNLRNLERTVFSSIGGIFCIALRVAVVVWM